MPERCEERNTEAMKLISLRCVLDKGHPKAHKAVHGHQVTYWLVDRTDCPLKEARADA